MADLRVWEFDGDTKVVAEDLPTALAEYMDHSGDSDDDVLEKLAKGWIRILPDGEWITICCDDIGLPCDPFNAEYDGEDSDGDGGRTMTAAAWAAKCGRGFLCEEM